MAPGVNVAIRELIGMGRLNATSVMTVAQNLDQGAADALGVLNLIRQGAATGLHVTLSAPFRPLTEAFRPLRESAFLPLGATLAHAMARRFDADILRAEIAAQFERFRVLFRRPPDFVDGHQHVHLFPQVRDAVLTELQRHAPGAWVRQCGRVRVGLSDPKALVLDVLSASFRHRAARLGIRTNTAFAGAYVFHDRADFAAMFPKFLDGLPHDGLVMCHPGHVDAELERLDPVTNLREREFAYLAGDRFLPALADAGVRLH